MHKAVMNTVHRVTHSPVHCNIFTSEFGTVLHLQHIAWASGSGGGGAPLQLNTIVIRSDRDRRSCLPGSVYITISHGSSKLLVSSF